VHIEHVRSPLKSTVRRAHPPVVPRGHAAQQASLRPVGAFCQSVGWSLSRQQCVVVKRLRLAAPCAQPSAERMQRGSVTHPYVESAAREDVHGTVSPRRSGHAEARQVLCVQAQWGAR
jgi:hypothetical protein